MSRWAERKFSKSIIYLRKRRVRSSSSLENDLVESPHRSLSLEDFLRESLWNLFVDYKKAGRLLTVKIDGEHESRHALLTFRKAEDVDKASTFATGKLINGTRLKAEPYDASAPGKRNETCPTNLSFVVVGVDNEECDPVKRSTCPDPDIDEYSIKATRTLYIGNLQSEISYNELREAYSAYGDIIVRPSLSFYSARWCERSSLSLSRNWKLNVKLSLNINFLLLSFNMRISRVLSKQWKPSNRKSIEITRSK